MVYCAELQQIPLVVHRRIFCPLYSRLNKHLWQALISTNPYTCGRYVPCVRRHHRDTNNKYRASDSSQRRPLDIEASDI